MEYIDKIYVINLKESKDRLQSFTQEMEKLRKPFTRIEGIRGSKLTKEDKKKITTAFCQNFCSDSLIGCALSHKKTWIQAYEENHDLVMICEDDCYFDPDFRNIFNKTYSYIPKDFDVLFLGGEGGCSYDQNYSFIFNMLVAFQKKKFKRINEHIYVPDLALAAHCYLVSRKGLKKLIDSVDRIFYHIDYQINKIENLKLYALEPKIAFQKTSLFTTNNVDIKYPYYINKYIAEHIKDVDGRPYSYIFSIPIIYIGPYPLTTWSILAFILGLIIGLTKLKTKKVLILFIFYHIIEIFTYPENGISFIGSLMFLLFGIKISKIFRN